MNKLDSFQYPHVKLGYTHGTLKSFYRYNFATINIISEDLSVKHENISHF